jgi:hypothetical protein
MATFNFTYDPGTTVQQMLGMEIAGRVWGRYLTDNTTLNIHVGVASSSDLGRNVIGGALPGMRANQSYLDYRTALNNGPKSANDNTALSTLPNKTTYTTSFVHYQLDQAVRQTESRATLNMTRAVAKAAGMSLPNGSTALDGYILFNNLENTTANGQAVRWSYDYTRSSTQATNTLDFLSTAIHEIGHVLGFVSGVDQPGLLGVQTDWDSLPPSQNSSTQDFIDGMRNRLQFINPLDLFRYSAAGVRNMDYGEIESGRIVPKYFSIDGGTTKVADFSSGLDMYNYGDGYQASHWKNGSTAIMNPTLSLNTRRNVAALDLRAMDVIGWDIASTGVTTTIDLSALQTQSQQALATRSGRTTTWITNNLTASPTSLVGNRDQQIYSMMENSVVYDMTRVTAPSSTGWTTRQTLAQVFQQRSLFSTVDELDGWVPEALPEVDITGLGPTGADLSALNRREALQAEAPMGDLNTVPAGSPVETSVLPGRGRSQIWLAAIASPTAASQPVAIALDQPMTLNSDDAGFSFIPYPTQTLNYGGGILNSQQTGVQSDEMGDRPFSLNDLTLDPTLLAGIAAL